MFHAQVEAGSSASRLKHAGSVRRSAPRLWNKAPGAPEGALEQCRLNHWQY
jgi:hypothetical protein